MPELLDLPNELLQLVAESFHKMDVTGIAALNITCRRMHEVSNESLWKAAIKRHPYLLCWATEVGRVGTMQKLLRAGADPNRAFRSAAIYREWNQSLESPKARFDSAYRIPWESISNYYEVGPCDLYLGSFTDCHCGFHHDTSSDMLERRLTDTWDSNLSQDENLSIFDGCLELWFPVHLAVKKANHKALAILVEHRAHLNVPSGGFCRCELEWSEDGRWERADIGWTPFHLALHHESSSIAQALLSLDPNIQERMSYESNWTVTPRLMPAIWRGSLSVAKFILENDLDNVNARDGLGHNPLWAAYEKSSSSALFVHEDMFKELLPLLIQKGADIDSDIGLGHTMLVDACCRERYDEALLLIRAGANVNVALEELQENSDLEDLIESLNDLDGYNSDVDIRGCTPIEICCQGFSLYNPEETRESASELVKELFHASAKTDYDPPLLCVAAKHRLSSVVEDLLDAGADVTIKDPQGMNPLDYAVMGRRGTGDLFGTISALIAHDTTDSFNREQNLLVIHTLCEEDPDLSGILDDSEEEVAEEVIEEADVAAD